MMRVVQVDNKAFSSSFRGLRVSVPRRVMNEYLPSKAAVSSDFALGDAVEKLFGYSKILVPDDSKRLINNAVLSFANMVSRFKGANWQRTLDVRGFDLDSVPGDIFVNVGIKGRKNFVSIPVTDIETGARQDLSDNFSFGYERLLTATTLEAKKTKTYKNYQRAKSQIDARFPYMFATNGESLVSFSKTLTGEALLGFIKRMPEDSLIRVNADIQAFERYIQKAASVKTPPHTPFAKTIMPLSGEPVDYNGSPVVFRELARGSGETKVMMILKEGEAYHNSNDLIASTLFGGCHPAKPAHRFVFVKLLNRDGSVNKMLKQELIAGYKRLIKPHQPQAG